MLTALRGLIILTKLSVRTATAQYVANSALTNPPLSGQVPASASGWVVGTNDGALRRGEVSLPVEGVGCPSLDMDGAGRWSVIANLAVALGHPWTIRL